MDPVLGGRTPKWGNVVKVVKGRKVPVGLVGRVFWAGATRYGYRVGIETVDGERQFTAASNVLVLASTEAEYEAAKVAA